MYKKVKQKALRWKKFISFRLKTGKGETVIFCKSRNPFGGRFRCVCVCLWDLGRKKERKDISSIFFPCGKKKKNPSSLSSSIFHKVPPVHSYKELQQKNVLGNSFYGPAFFQVTREIKHFPLLIKAKSTENFLVLFLPVGRPRKSLFLTERFSEERDTFSFSFPFYVFCVLRGENGRRVLFVGTRRWSSSTQPSFSDKKIDFYVDTLTNCI